MGWAALLGFMDLGSSRPILGPRHPPSETDIGPNREAKPEGEATANWEKVNEILESICGQWKLDSALDENVYV